MSNQINSAQNPTQGQSTAQSNAQGRPRNSLPQNGPWTQTNAARGGGARGRGGQARGGRGRGANRGGHSTGAGGGQRPHGPSTAQYGSSPANSQPMNSSTGQQSNVTPTTGSTHPPQASGGQTSTQQISSAAQQIHALPGAPPSNVGLPQVGPADSNTPAPPNPQVGLNPITQDASLVVFTGDALAYFHKFAPSGPVIAKTLSPPAEGPYKDQCFYMSLLAVIQLSTNYMPLDVCVHLYKAFQKRECIKADNCVREMQKFVTKALKDVWQIELPLNIDTPKTQEIFRVINNSNALRDPKFRYKLEVVKVGAQDHAVIQYPNWNWTPLFYVTFIGTSGLLRLQTPLPMLRVLLKYGLTVRTKAYELDCGDPCGDVTDAPDAWRYVVSQLPQENALVKALAACKAGSAPLAAVASGKSFVANSAAGLQTNLAVPSSVQELCTRLGDQGNFVLTGGNKSYCHPSLRLATDAIGLYALAQIPKGSRVLVVGAKYAPRHEIQSLRWDTDKTFVLQRGLSSQCSANDAAYLRENPKEDAIKYLSDNQISHIKIVPGNALLQRDSPNIGQTNVLYLKDVLYYDGVYEYMAAQLGSQNVSEAHVILQNYTRIPGTYEFDADEGKFTIEVQKPLTPTPAQVFAQMKELVREGLRLLPELIQETIFAPLIWIWEKWSNGEYFDLVIGFARELAIWRCLQTVKRVALPTTKILPLVLTGTWVSYSWVVGFTVTSAFYLGRTASRFVPELTNRELYDGVRAEEQPDTYITNNPYGQEAGYHHKLLNLSFPAKSFKDKNGLDWQRVIDHSTSANSQVVYYKVTRSSQAREIPLMPYCSEGGWDIRAPASQYQVFRQSWFNRFFGASDVRNILQSSNDVSSPYIAKSDQFVQQTAICYLHGSLGTRADLLNPTRVEKALSGCIGWLMSQHKFNSQTAATHAGRAFGVFRARMDQLWDLNPQSSLTVKGLDSEYVALYQERSDVRMAPLSEAQLAALSDDRAPNPDLLKFEYGSKAELMALDASTPDVAISKQKGEGPVYAQEVLIEGLAPTCCERTTQGSLYALLVRQAGHYHSEDEEFIEEVRPIIEAEVQQTIKRCLEFSYKEAPKPFEQYLAKYPSQKQKEYSDGFARFCETRRIRRTLSVQMKLHEAHIVAEGDQSIRPRNIFAPSKEGKAMGGYCSDILMEALQNTDPCVMTGKNSHDIERDLYKAYCSLKDPVMISTDGSSHDAHQFESLLNMIDNVLITQMRQELERRCIDVPYGGWDAIMEFLLRTKRTVQFVKFDKLMRKNIVYATLLLTGTVTSGHPTQTTLGNTLRCKIYWRVISSLAGQILGVEDPWGTGLFVFVAGDDVLVLLEAELLPAIRIAHGRVYFTPPKNQFTVVKHGMGQACKMLLIHPNRFTFLSKDGWFDKSGNHYFNRDPSRAACTGVVSFNAAQTNIPLGQYNQMVSAQLEGQIGDTIFGRALMEARYSKYPHANPTEENLAKFEDLNRFSWKHIQPGSNPVAESLLYTPSLLAAIGGSIGLLPAMVEAKEQALTVCGYK